MRREIEEIKKLKIKDKRKKKKVKDIGVKSKF
jgi:hypothetical protein